MRKESSSRRRPLLTRVPTKHWQRPKMTSDRDRPIDRTDRSIEFDRKTREMIDRTNIAGMCRVE